ncbi:uncharacterized protein PHACADRAFT_262991, partial [Phanerochaete carnosa HHB-10118-sp]
MSPFCTPSLSRRFPCRDTLTLSVSSLPSSRQRPTARSSMTKTPAPFMPKPSLASPTSCMTLRPSVPTRPAGRRNLAGGEWGKNKQLYKAVQSANWDDVVLDDKFKDGLRRDTKTFFESKEAYVSLNITWKRGILLLGPPGNGKTESIKALLHETKGAAPLYVKSFTTCRGPEEGVQAIFEHARAHKPCILILEDLDAMLVPEVRSLFLNELDGLADNEGILTIATTNHPERIDDAILNRPSRFDVKYEFTLPDIGLRKAFAVKWLGKVNALAANTGIIFENPEDVASAVSDKTEGWSYAFLKELFVSFLLRLAHDKSLRQTGMDVSSEPVESVLLKQVDQLAAQITKGETPEEAKGSG